MKPGRALSLLIGVALLIAIARFNEMTPDARASWLGDAVEAARTMAQSLTGYAAAAYNAVTAPSTEPAVPQPRAASSGADTAPARRTAARTTEAEPPPSGNPLWALPLKQLSMTRDRPIFSPSRRPPPSPTTLVAPVAVRQPVKPAEPVRPTVTLLGTIIGSGSDDQIGIFLDAATHDVIRLRVGEDHQGWVLRAVKAREVTLAKDGEQTVVLELPQPGDTPSPLVPPPGVPPVPAGINGTAAAARFGVPPVPGVATGTLPIPSGPLAHGQRLRQRQRLQ